MRPIRLSLQAFGPFAGREEVNFEALGPDALFLIHGPTGSGKSTLLDAMCFALYGQSLGGERSGEQLRSDHAAADVFTQVDFEFGVGSHRYRVIRSPMQLRPKKSGEGHTTEKPQATLYDAVDDELMVTGKSKVDQKIKEVLGFACDDFRQVVMLPQGRFRELLSSSSTDRQEILARIFETAKYKALADALKKRADTLREEARHGLLIREQLLASVEVENSEALHQAISENEAQRTQLNAVLEADTRALRTAQKHLKDGEQVQALFEAQKIAENALAEAKKTQPQIDLLKNGLLLARKAMGITEVHVRLEGAQTALNGVKRQLVVALDAKEKSQKECVSAKAALEGALKAEQEIPGWRKRLVVLNRSVDKVAAVEQLQEKLVATQKSGLEAEQAFQKTKALAEQLQQKRKELGEQLQQRRDLDVQLGELNRQRQQVQQSMQVVAIDVDLKASDDKLTHQEAQRQAAVQELDEAEKKRQDAEQQRMNQSAGVLARSLEEGVSCPVCGSMEHPSPAEPCDEEISDDALKVMQDEIRQLKSVLQNARDAVGATRLRIEGLKGQRIQIDHIEIPLEELKRNLDRMEQRFVPLKELPTLDVLTQNLDAVQVQFERVETQNAEAHAANLYAKQTLAGLTEELTEAKGQLPEGVRTAVEIHGMIAAIEGRIQEVEEQLSEGKVRVANAQTAHEGNTQTEKQLRAQEVDALSRVEVDKAAFAKALEAGGFAGKAAWESACVPGAIQDGMTADLSRLEAQLEAAKVAVEKSKTATNGLVWIEDMLERKEQVGLANAARDATLSSVGKQEESLSQLAKVLEKIQEQEAQSDSVEGRYAVAGKLSEVANGRNARNMNFESYVLGVMLDDVLQRATARLQKMSRGRYTLHRSMRVDDGRKRAGLDLEVMDHWTGHSRAVSTLSGGEGFQAALSLALGLADVIQSYTGGIHLEAVFVDEGFGSLDPEALEMAMRALQDLRKSGRLVGLISHVSELKGRIDTRIEVSTSRTGSHIQVQRS